MLSKAAGAGHPAVSPITTVSWATGAGHPSVASSKATGAGHPSVPSRKTMSSKAIGVGHVSIASKTMSLRPASFRAWGAADVGVFVDWASLYQQPRDEAQAASYLRATANVPMWSATAFRTEHLPSLRERPLVWGMTLPNMAGSATG